MHRRTLLLILPLLLLTGCGKEAPVAPASVGIPASIQKVSLMDFTESAYFIGELASSQEYDIPTGQAGAIQQVFVKVGDRVTKGQSLFVIEHNQLLVDLGSQEIQLQNQVALTDLQAAEAQKQWDNTSTLFEQGAVSKDAYDQARLRLDQARYAAANAKETLKATTSRLKTQIADAVVKSPVSGLVASSAIQTGQEVGNITAMKIVGTASMVVKASVPETIIPKVKIGQNATVAFGDNRSDAVPARVIRIDAVPSSQSHLYGVELQLEATDAALRSGMYAEVNLVTASFPQKVGIPKTALRKDDAGSFVVLEVQGKAVLRPVKPGLVNGESVEILEGLTAGENLIIKGQTYLKEGDAVLVTD